MKRIITFGTFDLLHDGHLRILERAREMGDYLIVGVSTDRLNALKGKRSFFGEEHRMRCVAALKMVDEVFYEDSLERKDHYIRQHRADVLVMGEDWSGKFDWVSCKVVYLPRTPGISSTDVKVGLSDRFKCKRALFGDTYIRKHYDCALSLINELTAANVAPIFSAGEVLPDGVDCDCLVYFNLPVNPPGPEYAGKVRVLVDHGASHLKWFLSEPARFDFFDVIVTAGPDHSESLLTFFADDVGHADKIRSAGFIKSEQLLSPARLSREEIAHKCALDPSKPIILFAPTWHVSNQPDMAEAIAEIAGIENHVALLHPETEHLDVSTLNVAANESGMVSELLKHADCVVSDLSSTIFEAAALGKPVVQILLMEYSDNNAVVYDFPYTAGTAELFCGGLPVRPGDVSQAIARILGGDQAAAAALDRMRRRILRGTMIHAESARAVVAEIARASDLERPGDPSKRHAAATSYPSAHKNLFFSRNRLIANSGGAVGGIVESNSIEAVKQSLYAVDWVALDFVRCADGIVVAEPDTEARYGVDKPFREISWRHFMQSRFDRDLTPISLDDALDLCAREGRALICNIAPNADFGFVAARLHALACSLDVGERVVPRCCTVEHFNAALRLGFSRIMLAIDPSVHPDPFSPSSLEFIDACLEINARCVIGVAIPYKSPFMALSCLDDRRVESLYATWKRIYVRGAPVNEYSRLLNANFGLFADGYSTEFEFSACPENFHWPTYLFLNPDVAKAGLANPTGATLHYLNYGRGEQRLTVYDTPGDFDYQRYLDMNTSLRDAGIGGEDRAKAHWTKYGAAENRRYKP